MSIALVHCIAFLSSFNITETAFSILNTRLTLHESDDTTENGKHPKRWSEDRNKVKNGTNEPTDEQWILPAKLVRDGTHAYAPNKKSEEDNRGWDESKWAAFTDKVELWKKMQFIKTLL